MCSDIRLICREFKTLNARGCVSNLHTDYLNPMLYIMYAWNGLSKCMQKLEIFLKTMIIPFCSMSLSTILLLQTCESLIDFLSYVWLFSAYFICMKSYVIYICTVVPSHRVLCCYCVNFCIYVHEIFIIPTVQQEMLHKL